MDFFDRLKESCNKATQAVSGKVKEKMEISRLTRQGKNIHRELDGLFNKIGQTFVEFNGEASEALSALQERAAELHANLRQLELQKLQIKKRTLCPNCGSTVAAEAHFCPNCGAKLPEPEPAPAEPEAPVAEEPVQDEPEAPAEKETVQIEPEAPAEESSQSE